MATSWKSQQGDGMYYLQFETDDKEKYNLVEKAVQTAIDGKTTADVVEVVRCKDCVDYIPNADLDHEQLPNDLEADGYCDNWLKYTDAHCFCSSGRKEIKERF